MNKDICLKSENIFDYINNSDVKTKVGHVAKFNDIEDDDLYSLPIKIKFFYSNYNQQITMDEDYLKKFDKSKQFIGLTKQELKSYIDKIYWKRIVWIILILYIMLLLLLIFLSIIIILFSFKCPSNKNLIWYEKEIIYEIDLKYFRDSNYDGIGDIQGLEEKFDYFEKNFIKSILFQSSIFNSTDLFTFNQDIIEKIYFEYFIKILHRKNMHLIIDLPLSSTHNNTFSSKINNSCQQNTSNLDCRYYTQYGRFPLDFNNKKIAQQAETYLHDWLLNKKIDGIRVDLPIELNEITGLYSISYKTINQWNYIKSQIEQKTNPKIILFDIPYGLNDLLIKNNLHKKLNYPKEFLINSFELNHFLIPKFWQLGSIRMNKQIENNLSKQIQLTIGMLIGGTPIILYGEELGIEQKINRFMFWTSDKPSGGFSSCLTDHCLRLFSSHNIDISKTNVKREEAIGGNNEDSLLILFRYLSKLRQFSSFQFGLLKKEYNLQLNIFWFIREAPGHRGFIIVINLNVKEKDMIHLSLYKITNNIIPEHIYYEYQWPNVYFSTLNKTSIDSDNLFIHSQSINIFSWKPRRLLKQNFI